MASRKSKTKKNASRPKPRAVPASAASKTASVRSVPEKEFAELKPKPLSGERIEDLAVLSNVGREQLAEEWKLDCAAVIESLQLVSDGKLDEANERVKYIARSSPYADWRLFVRGLCAFYNSDFETARLNWQRLDTTRRPARIAATLLTAELGDSLANTTTPPQHLVKAAKVLMHRSHAVAAAKAILAVKHRDPEVLFSTSQVAMLINFRDDFRRADPEFVARFSQACVYVACHQSAPDAFVLLQKSVPGPPHDPNWNLQQFVFLREFDEVDDLREVVAFRYIFKDLPKITQFSADQKGALASCMLTDLSAFLLAPEPTGMFRFFSYDPPDFKKSEKLLVLAVQKYPSNRAAHKALMELIDRQAKDRLATKAENKAAEERLLVAKANFVAACPSEIELSLELVDHYFNNDELDKADALVKQLSTQRVDSPLAKALPWKIQMLTAMHKSRRKSELKAVRQSLEAAKSLWPAWLAPTWLPFLQAAVELRSGDKQAFESMDNAARKSAGVSQVVGDTMSFAAIQQMNVTAADIKPYRDKLTEYLDAADELPLDDLISIGAFFWDLTRVGIEHKGFRLQAAKFGKTISERMKKREKVVRDATLVDAVCFVASRGFWQTSNTKIILPWAEEFAKTELRVLAAFMNWLIKSSYAGYELRNRKSNIESFEEAARTEKDTFYRYYFESVAKAANEVLLEFNQQMFPWGRPATRSAAPRLESDQDYEEDFDDECNCADCRAERAREAKYAARKKSKQSKPTVNSTPSLFENFLLEDDDEDDFDDGLDDIADDNAAGYSSYQVDNFPGNPAEMGSRHSSIEQFVDLDNLIDGPEDTVAPPATPKTAAEKKADFKKRRRELEKKKKR